MKNWTLNIIVAFLLVSVSYSAKAQNILVNEDPNVTSMMNKYIRQSQEEDKVSGWRIQIITTDDRRKMERAESKFKMMYPNMSVERTHESPYYKVKTGAWDNKLYLQVFLQQIQADFPSAIPVVAKIREDVLLTY